MTINYELRNRPDAAGMCLLRICFQDKGKRSYQAMKLKLRQQDWDSDKQQVKASHPQAAMINKVLKEKMVEVQLAPQVVERISFRTYAMDWLNRWEKTKSHNTIRAYQSMLRQVGRFGNPFLNEINPEWLLRFDQWSRADGCDDAGTLKRVSFISTILSEALKYGKIDRNPFSVYQKPKKINPKRVWLTHDELGRIGALECDNLLKNVRVWFLLACYTGLRYSDIPGIENKQQEGRLILYTTKTGEVVSLKINKHIQALLDQWPPVPVYSNAKCNQYLKALAHVCKIDKPLTFHVARHTFAVQCANLGISQEVTGKLLGHSDLRTTGIYYKIVNQRIDKEMDKWN